MVLTDRRNPTITTPQLPNRMLEKLFKDGYMKLDNTIEDQSEFQLCSL